MLLLHQHLANKTFHCSMVAVNDVECNNYPPVVIAAYRFVDFYTLTLSTLRLEEIKCSWTAAITIYRLMRMHGTAIRSPYLLSAPKPRTGDLRTSPLERLDETPVNYAVVNSARVFWEFTYILPRNGVKPHPLITFDWCYACKTAANTRVLE